MLGTRYLVVIHRRARRQRPRQRVEPLVRPRRCSPAWLKVRHRIAPRRRSNPRPNSVLRLPFSPSPRSASVALVSVTIRMLPKANCISNFNNLTLNMPTSHPRPLFMRTRPFSSLAPRRLPLRSGRAFIVLPSSRRTSQSASLLIRNCLPLIYTSTISIRRRFALCWSTSTQAVCSRRATRSKAISIRSISFGPLSSTIWTNCVNWPSPRC